MVTLVVTEGTGSMDLYGQRLCQHMKNTEVVRLSFPEPFGTPLFSPHAVKFLIHSGGILKTLRRYQAVHLTNHHLARFAFLLKNTACILTVHDLIRHFDRQRTATYIRQPTFRDKIDLWLDWQGIKSARHIIAVSHHTKNDLVNHAGIPEERITVVYHGIDHDVFYPRPEPRPLDYPYILFVGSEHPRKNLATLLRAFHKLKWDGKFRELKLVKVGKAGGMEYDFRTETLKLVQSLGLDGEVVFTDYVSEDMLANYYSHAECLILPSLYEGFGWPPVEAMACGCPVVVSNVTALPEITGDAALKIEPRDDSNLARAIGMVLTDDRLKRQLVSKGLERASNFTWGKAAQETLRVYREVEHSLGVGYVPAEVAVSSAAWTMASASVKGVILVGGEGTRLRPLTYYTPKPMVPVLNRPFLEHTLSYLEKYGVKEVVLALSYLPGAIQHYFGDEHRPEALLRYCVEASPLGTAGAVKNAEGYLNDTFIVLNGDIFTNLDIRDMLTFHRSKKAVATIALTWVDNPCAFGVVETDSDGRVRRFIEKPSPDRVTSQWINAGIYILEPEVLRHVPAGSHYMFERGLFPLLLSLGQPVYGYTFDGYWLDMGTPEKYLRLNHDLLTSRAQSPLVAQVGNGVRHGQNVTIHPTVRIDGPVIIGDGCDIGQGVCIQGPAVIGQKCRIQEGAAVEAAVLWDSVTVGVGAVIKHSIVGTNVTIPFGKHVASKVITPEHIAVISLEDLDSLKQIAQDSHSSKSQQAQRPKLDWKRGETSSHSY